MRFLTEKPQHTSLNITKKSPPAKELIPSHTYLTYPDTYLPYLTYLTYQSHPPARSIVRFRRWEKPPSRPPPSPPRPSSLSIQWKTEKLASRSSSNFRSRS